MAYDVAGAARTPNYLATAQQGYQFGTQQRLQREQEADQNMLRALTPEALAGNYEAQNKILAISPQHGAALRTATADRGQQLKGLVDNLDPLVQQARTTGDWRHVNAILPQASGLIQALTGKPGPTAWEPGMDQGWDALKAQASMYGGAAGGTPAQMQVFEAQARAAGLQPGTPEYQRAAQIALGLEGRASGAAIGYKVIKGADGRERLVAVDPREPGAMIIDGSQGFGGGTVPPAAAPAPTSAPAAPQQVAVVADAQGQADDEFANLPAAVRMRVAELEAAGKPFHIAGGRLVEGFSEGMTPASVSTPAPSPDVRRPTLADVPINAYGGGAFVSQTPGEKAAEEARAKAGVELETAPQIARATKEAEYDAQIDARPEIDALDAQRAFDMKAAEARAERAEAQRGQGRAYDLYATASRGLADALKNTPTNPVSGSLPAVTAAAQTAEGAIAAMAPVLKQLFRQAGEGVFTDKDQALLIAMLPTRMDHPQARDAKLANIDAIVQSKLGIDGSAPADDAPVAGARKAPDGNWYVQQNGQWFKVD